MKYFLNSILVLIYLNTYAQQELENNYQTELTEFLKTLDNSTESTDKISAYKDFIRNSFPAHLDQVFQYSEALLELSTMVGDNKSKAFANYFIGNYFFEKENFLKANESFKKALIIYDELKDTLQIAIINHILGLTNHYLNHYNLALVYYQESVKLNGILGKTMETAVSYQDIGTLYNDLKKYSLAQNYYEKALHIYEKHGDYVSIAAINQNIGVLHHNWGNFNESLDYYKKSLEVYESLQDKRNIAISLSNIGSVYEENKRFYKALEYYQKALLIFEEIDSKQMLVYIFYNLGSLFSNLKDYPKSIEYYEKGVTLSSEISMKDYILHNYEALSGIYEKMGSYRKSLRYYKEYNLIKDSIFNEEKFKQIQLLEAEFQNAGQQKEIELLKLDKELRELQLKKKEAQNLVLIFSLILGFLVVIVLLFFYRYQKRISIKLYSEIEKRKFTENQLYAIKDEIEIRIKKRIADIEKAN